jgi:ATP-dependent DNA helicase Rep
LSNLNASQRAAVRYVEGPLLVLAGAGSGKTRVLTEKIAYLIQTRDMDPGHIAAVTFTNKAAREMRQRVAKLLGKGDMQALRVSTFHSLGLDILRHDGRRLGVRSGFSIYDEHDCTALLAEIMQCDRTDARVGEMRHRISAMKNALIGPGEGGDGQGEAVVYAVYEEQLRARNAVDFDDLIALPVRLLREHGEAAAYWKEKIRYLLVDEYQDTNSAQYELVRLLIDGRGGLTVVGDDDQSIYGWRGAQPQNLAALKTDFPNLQVIKLEQNYRSMGRILKAANCLIANNPHVFEKRLWSELGPGDPLRVMRAADEVDEAERVVNRLLHHKLMKNGKFGDYAILYRGNHQSRPFERVLRERNAPYLVSGGMSFFEYAEVRDVMAYLRLLANPEDDAALLRIINTPRREIGPGTVEKLNAHARGRGLSLFAASFDADLAGHLAARGRDRLVEFARWVSELSDRAEREEASAIVIELLNTIGYQQWLIDNAVDPADAERRWANVGELVEWLKRIAQNAEGDVTLREAVARLTLLDVLERREDEKSDDRVRLMTLHAAKGLEFAHVFLVGMEETLLPHRASIEADAIEEERRLAYVGITRARRNLTFSFAASRRRYGEIRDCEPSRFLQELPAEDLEWEGGAEAAPSAAAENGRETLARLKRMLDA